jgi:hypothetical protein
VHDLGSLDAANDVLHSEASDAAVNYGAVPSDAEKGSIAAEDIMAACTVLSPSEETVALQEAFEEVKQLHHVDDVLQIDGESETVESSNGLEITPRELSSLRQAVAMHVAVVLLTAKIASRATTKIEPAEFRKQFVETARHILEDVYVHGRALYIALADYTNESIVRSVTGDDSHQEAVAAAYM